MSENGDEDDDDAEFICYHQLYNLKLISSMEIWSREYFANSSSRC